jgi:serine/threonine-protein kinase
MSKPADSQELQSDTTDPTSTPDHSGRLLGDYQLIRRLGRGGMADVYLAQQNSLARKVAIKILRPNLARNESYLRRFLNEARAAAALVHPNIVQVYEVGVLDGLHYIAQEYVAGQNVRQLLARSGPLSAPLTIAIMRQVAVGLRRAAGQGIVHRDIKPENILLARTGEAKVADFGLARITNGESNTQLTQIGVTMGTPLYMSPEQVEGKALDLRSDLYSLGVSCYHMLAGRPPFRGETPLSIAVQHLKSEPERLERIRPDLPEGLCRIVHKLMAKRPEDRYQDTAEVLRDLKELPIESPEDDWPQTVEDANEFESGELNSQRAAATQKLASLMILEARHDAHRNPLIVWGLLVIAGAAAGGGAAFAFRPPPLLDTRAVSGLVEHKDNIQDQFLLAVALGTEQALRAVEEYFPRDADPENLHYARLAEQRLAELYLEKQRYDDALRIYTAVARDPATGASGQIGLTNAHHRKNPSDGQWRNSLMELVRIVESTNIENHLMAMQQLDAEPRELYLELRDLKSRPRQGS